MAASDNKAGDLSKASRDAAAEAGDAMPDGSYPIRDRDELEKAIHAVGRGKNNSHDAIRRHIIKRAKALGLSNLIPDDWNDSGGRSASERWSARLDLPLTQKRSEAMATRQRALAARIGVQLRSEGGEAPVPGWESTPFTGRIIGTPMTWNNRTYVGVPPWGFAEELAPRSADRSAATDDIRLLREHDPALLLARTSAGTLKLSPDNVGIRSDAMMAPTSIGIDTAILIQRGDLTGMSFAFRTSSGGEEWSTVSGVDDPRFPALRSANVDLCRVKDMTLKDVSLVTYPSYSGTKVSNRNDSDTMLGERELEMLELELLYRKVI